MRESKRAREEPSAARECAAGRAGARLPPRRPAPRRQLMQQHTWMHLIIAEQRSNARGRERARSNTFFGCVRERARERGGW